MTKKTVQKKTNSTSLENIENSKLSVQFSLDGFSFSISDENTHETVYFAKYQFDKTQSTPEKLLLKIEDIFKKDTHLQQNFATLFVIHQNNLSTLVPNTYFDKDKLKEYLNFNIKTLTTDFIAFDSIESIQAKNIYVPYININNFLFQNFGEFDYVHQHSVLIDKLIAQATHTEKRMYVNVHANTFDIVVLEEKKLILANSFSYNSKEDFIYYILFTAEQLKLDTEQFTLSFTGDIKEESDIYKISYQYIKNIQFLESNNPIFNELNLPKHSNFTLLG